MSVVTVTDLPLGDVATSSAVNATLTSWNNATAAGSINQVNVNLEGIDRRSLSPSAHVVFTTEVGTNTPTVVTPNSTVHNATGVYVVVPGPMETIQMTVASTTRILLHCSLYMESAAIPAGNALRVDLILQVSDDGGATWTDLVGTRQQFQMRDTGSYCSVGGPNDIPGIATSATWSTFVVQGANPVTYRAAFKTVNDSTTGGTDITFKSGTIFVETLGA